MVPVQTYTLHINGFYAFYFISLTFPRLLSGLSARPPTGLLFLFLFLFFALEPYFFLPQFPSYWHCFQDCAGRFLQLMVARGYITWGQTVTLLCTLYLLYTTALCLCLRYRGMASPFDIVKPTNPLLLKDTLSNIDNH